MIIVDNSGPNTYNSERGDEYLEGVKAITIGARLKEAKKFLTPSPVRPLSLLLPLHFCFCRTCFSSSLEEWV